LTPVVGDYVLTAENLITGSLADDDVAMGGYHIGIHRPSGSGGGGIAAAQPQEKGCRAVITRGFGGRRRDDTDLPPGQYRTDDFSLVLLGSNSRESCRAVPASEGERGPRSRVH
jgi:hypothetical protein